MPSLDVMLGKSFSSEPSEGRLPELCDESPADRWTFGLLAALLILGYAFVAHVYWAPAHPGYDQNGYLVGGKLFSKTWSTGFKPANQFAFVGREWVEVSDGRFFPKYPPGLSVIYAITLKLGGVRHGIPITLMVSPVAMTLGLAATFLLVRMAAGSFAALLATLVLCCGLATLALTDNPNSHGSALFCTTTGMLLALRWWQRYGWFHAIAGGLLLGISATIRYTEGLVLLPLALVALMNIRLSSRKSLWQGGAMLTAWAAPVIAMFLYNWFSFHHLTGYDPTNESKGFTLQALKENWEVMFRQIYDMGLFFILPFAALGLMLMWRWNWRFTLVICAWIFPNLILYSAYYWAPDGTTVSYLRFFLTVFPPLVLAAAWTFRKIIDWASQEGATVLSPLAIGVVVALGCALSLRLAIPETEGDSKTNNLLNEATHTILAKCPAGSAIFATDRMLNFLQFAGDYQCYTIEQFNRSYVQRYAQVNLSEPSAFQPQRAQEVYDRYKNFSEPELIALQNKLMAQILACGHRVFFLVPRESVGNATRFINPKQYTFKMIGGWDEPADEALHRRRFGGNINPVRWWAVDQNRSVFWEIIEAMPIAPAHS